MPNLNTPITQINRVGTTVAKRLGRLGINTIYDLLVYFPYRYDDFRRLTSISQLEIGQTANIVGQIELIQNKRSPKKRMYITEALISDQTGQIKIIWFNQPFIAKNLRSGDKISLTGKVESGAGEEIMRSPAYEKISGGQAIHTQGIVPNYRLTANITQKQIRFLIKQVINKTSLLNDWLPPKIVKKQKFYTLGQAIKKIHFPENFFEIDQVKKRLAFNELFLLQLNSQITKAKLQSKTAEKIAFKEKETKEFVDSLPFSLTGAQKKTAWEVLQAIGKKQPMSRLLEGDVGSGKTLVAVIAMYNAALNKKQSVLMVPTEILAKQHYNLISRLLQNFNVQIGLITRFKKIYSKIKNQKSKIKNSAQEIIKNSDIIIGTHALIQEKIEFKNLALAVIDEQHRFGVGQRKMLVNKINRKSPASSAQAGWAKIKKQELPVPHLLSMTATPIPRSLALALYGDLDLSIIDELPKGRKKILTKVVPENQRENTYNFIRDKIKDGRQIFVVCPLIDFSDKLGVKSVKDEFQKLNNKIFRDIKIGMLHGRMKPKDKEAVMRNFLGNRIKILVSTSVVEVGVDVPNACIMMIEGADRFGLAQLHQFRGRVGRSEHQSYCFLFTDAKSKKSLNRLKALEACDDGFALAKTDLKFRGPGAVYGTAQTGFPEFKIATLFDYELLKLASAEALNLIARDPQLAKNQKLKEKIKKLNGITHLE
ncbi:MAG: ATP-dependent DNA helicase RecG [Patescibacteria group bacterium]|nr:ATP-dependent DNA helicase RecG [Patescibacteria group bacterium]